MLLLASNVVLHVVRFVIKKNNLMGSNLRQSDEKLCIDFADSQKASNVSKLMEPNEKYIFAKGFEPIACE